MVYPHGGKASVDPLQDAGDVRSERERCLILTHSHTYTHSCTFAHSFSGGSVSAADSRQSD